MPRGQLSSSCPFMAMPFSWPLGVSFSLLSTPIILAFASPPITPTRWPFFFHELLRQLSGVFRELKARQEVDVARGTAYLRFPDALGFVGLVELRPLLL